MAKVKGTDDKVLQEKMIKELSRQKLKEQKAAILSKKAAAESSGAPPGEEAQKDGKAAEA